MCSYSRCSFAPTPRRCFFPGIVLNSYGVYDPLAGRYVRLVGVTRTGEISNVEGAHAPDPSPNAGGGVGGMGVNFGRDGGTSPPGPLSIKGGWRGGIAPRPGSFSPLHPPLMER